MNLDTLTFTQEKYQQRIQMKAWLYSYVFRRNDCKKCYRLEFCYST